MSQRGAPRAPRLKKICTTPAEASGTDVVAEPTRAIDAGYVDVDDGFVRLRQARRRADADARAFAGEAARGKHGHRGIARGELLGEGGGGRVVELRRVDRHHSIAEFPLLRLGARPR